MKQLASARVRALGSAIFAEVAAWKQEALQNGHDLIDLGIGSPDQPPTPLVMETLARYAKEGSSYGYPTSEGSLALRETVAKWMAHRFGVQLDAQHEVTMLMGSQDGLAHLAMAVADPGDIAIVPDPGYPIYHASLALAGVEPYMLPLRAENGYLPDLESIPDEVASRARFLLLNYPSNPLSAVADLSCFTAVIAFAKKHQLLVVHDAAYTEMAFDGYRPPSILQVEGAKEIAVEFHSMSKSFHMAGCRLAFLVGHAEAVGALRTLKSNIDYGVFTAIQEAAIAALEQSIAGEGQDVGALYETRRNIVVDGLHAVGWTVPKPLATMFVWALVPKGWTSRQISREMLISTGVAVIPGDAFGSQGEGYVRIALVQPEERLREAVRRIGHFLEQHRTR